MVTLRFELDRPASVNLRIFDVQGREVSTVSTGRMGAGIHVEKWDGRTRGGAPAASGVYFARLESSQAKSVRRFRSAPMMQRACEAEICCWRQDASKEYPAVLLMTIR